MKVRHADRTTSLGEPPRQGFRPSSSKERKTAYFPPVLMNRHHRGASRRRIMLSEAEQRLDSFPTGSIDPADEPRRHTWYESGKAVLDFMSAAILLVLAAPLILLIMAVVKLTSPGPVIYSQKRLGQDR